MFLQVRNLCKSQCESSDLCDAIRIEIINFIAHYFQHIHRKSSDSDTVERVHFSTRLWKLARVHLATHANDKDVHPKPHLALSKTRRRLLAALKYCPTRALVIAMLFEVTEPSTVIKLRGII